MYSMYMQLKKFSTTSSHSYNYKEKLKGTLKKERKRENQGDYAGSTLMALEESWLANPLNSRLQNYARR